MLFLGRVITHGLIHVAVPQQLSITLLLLCTLSLSLAAFESCEGKVLALRYNNEFVPEITSGQQAGVLLDRTCFYAEAGGQIYDVGFMSKVGDEVCVCVQ